jgi:hypothetical protein
MLRISGHKKEAEKEDDETYNRELHRIWRRGACTTYERWETYIIFSWGRRRRLEVQRLFGSPGWEDNRSIKLSVICLLWYDDWSSRITDCYNFTNGKPWWIGYEEVMCLETSEYLSKSPKVCVRCCRVYSPFSNM